MNIRNILLRMVVLCLILMTACGGNGGNGDNNIESDGVIRGTIENFNTELGKVPPVNVYVISENPDEEDDFELSELTIVGQTVAVSNDNYETYSYSISDIPAGEYYVIAYKDINGNGKLDADDEGPIDAAGFYGMPELAEMEGEEEIEPAKVIVEGGEEYNNINFPIFSIAAASTPSQTGKVMDAEGEALDGIEVELYGTGGLKVAESVYTDAEGNYSFAEPLILGEYYIKTSSAGLMPSITPVFFLIPGAELGENEEDTFVHWKICDIDVLEDYEAYAEDVLVGGNLESLPVLFMYTEGEAEDYGYISGSVFLTGQIRDQHTNFADINGIAGAEAILDTDVGEVGYYNGEWVPDFTLGETQEDGGGWFTIKNVSDGEYQITASKTGSNFYEYTLIVEEDSSIAVEIIPAPPEYN